MSDRQLPRSRFIVLDLSIEIVRLLRQPVARVQTHNPGLASQIRRAATSIALNVSEANRRSGADRRQRFRIAAGSADETRTGLELALAWGYLREGEIEKPSAVIDRVLGMLYSLTR